MENTSQHLEQLTYIVLDFETVTPKGRPPEPIELAALRLRPPLLIDHTFTFEAFIKPPPGAPITPFDTAQTGIRWDDVKDALMASEVLRRFDEMLHP